MPWVRGWDSVTLQEETALRVKQLEVKFAHFEADTSITDCCLIEIDEELEVVCTAYMGPEVTSQSTSSPEVTS